MARPILCDRCGKETRTVSVTVSLNIVAGVPEYGERDLVGDWCVGCLIAKTLDLGHRRPDFDAARSAAGIGDTHEAIGWLLGALDRHVPGFVEAEAEKARGHYEREAPHSGVPAVLAKWAARNRVASTGPAEDLDSIDALEQAVDTGEYAAPELAESL